MSKQLANQLNADLEPGHFLKDLRLREEYTQSYLSQLIGTSANNISSMERGKRPIGKKTAQKLAAIFKVRYQCFL